MASKNEIGIKASQRGFDTEEASDYQQLFSSSWPLLKIYDHGAFNISNTAVDITIASHTLGYTPMFWVFDTSGFAATNASGASRLAFPGSSQYITMNDVALKWAGATRGASGLTTTYSGYYFIFYQPMEQEYESSIVQSQGLGGGSDTNVGIKVAKTGFDVDDRDLRNFVLHTSARSPIIHKIGTGTIPGSPFQVNYTHNLGYEPMYFVYAKLTSYGDSSWSMVTTASDTSVVATSSLIQFTIPYTGSYTYVVFKDPVLLD